MVYSFSSELGAMYGMPSWARQTTQFGVLEPERSPKTQVPSLRALWDPPLGHGSVIQRRGTLLVQDWGHCGRCMPNCSCQASAEARGTGALPSHRSEHGGQGPGAN